MGARNTPQSPKIFRPRKGELKMSVAQETRHRVKPALQPIYPGMVHVQGGNFTMGSDRHLRLRRLPAHRVKVDGFGIHR